MHVFSYQNLNSKARFILNKNFLQKFTYPSWHNVHVSANCHFWLKWLLKTACNNFFNKKLSNCLRLFLIIKDNSLTESDLIIQSKRFYPLYALRKSCMCGRHQLYKKLSYYELNCAENVQRLVKRDR